MFRVTKTFGHDIGLSCAFRQWRATHSHCHFIHGYALAFSLVFEADALDERNWVVDFGGLKEIRKFLTANFDHTLVIAADDPCRKELEVLAGKGIATVLTLPAVGCEAFAAFVYDKVDDWVRRTQRPGVRLVSVTVSEHGANSASFAP